MCTKMCRFILEAGSSTLLYFDNEELTKLKGEVDLQVADLNLIPDATAPTPLVFQVEEGVRYRYIHV